MNTSAVIEQPATIVESEPALQPETAPVGNAVYIFEVSNVVIGSFSEMVEDFKDSQIAAMRMSEETESMEKVFSDLRVA